MFVFTCRKYSSMFLNAILRSVSLHGFECYLHTVKLTRSENNIQNSRTTFENTQNLSVTEKALEAI